MNEKFSLVFPVPKSGNHRETIDSYLYRSSEIENLDLGNSFVICDENLKNTFVNEVLNGKDIYYINSAEGDIKEIGTLGKFIDGHQNEIVDKSRIVAMGGGIILNITAYIAEKFTKDLVYIPTTIISMSDGSMGGKVRVNKIEGNIFIKHFYKSFYEPNEILIDKRFLNSLSEEGIRVGVAEVVKHGVYQSAKLLEYLNSQKFNPHEDKDSLWKAILWTASLKKVCLDIDYEETKEGSNIILRGGHDISDKIEEESRFTIHHGRAVTMGMWQDLESANSITPAIEAIYSKLGLAKA